ncbi:MAG TPA: HNH endonuclease [Ktedonosporobacter sp.]|nr:HNH endonuclease [Ktedonosporobacter sp.]
MDRRRFLYSVVMFLVMLIGIFLWVRFKGAATPATTSHPSTRGSVSGTPGAGATTIGPVGAEPKWGVQVKTSGCQVRGPLEDPLCTPGALLPATKETICVSGYAGSVRNVPQSLKDQVYREYGISSHAPGQYEVDHLVSLQLGGSNEIANLWPEAANPTPGFHEKDAVENYLHAQICSGAISLKEAQIEIATNWLAVYHRMKGNPSDPGAGNP